MIRAEFTQADVADLVERVKVKVRTMISDDFVVDVERAYAADFIAIELVKRVEATNIGTVSFHTPKNWMFALLAEIRRVTRIGWIQCRYDRQTFRFYKTVTGAPEKYMLVREYSDEAAR